MERQKGLDSNVCIIFQDAMDQLFQPTSARDTGTLFHLKNRFRHSNLKGNVMENYMHVHDMMEVSNRIILLLSTTRYWNS